MLLLFVAIDQRIAMASPIVLTETSQKPKPKPILDSPKPDAGASSGTESKAHSERDLDQFINSHFHMLPCCGIVRKIPINHVVSDMEIPSSVRCGVVENMYSRCRIEVQTPILWVLFS